MNRYIIRVELHDAAWQNYVEMAKDLAKQGVTDEIVADNGSRYRMSPAEYNYVGSEPIETVLNAVRASAAKTGKRHAVFVTEANRTQWVGLEAAQARRTA